MKTITASCSCLLMKAAMMITTDNARQHEHRGITENNSVTSIERSRKKKRTMAISVVVVPPPPPPPPNTHAHARTHARAHTRTAAGWWPVYLRRVFSSGIDIVVPKGRVMIVCSRRKVPLQVRRQGSVLCLTIAPHGFCTYRHNQ